LYDVLLGLQRCAAAGACTTVFCPSNNRIRKILGNDTPNINLYPLVMDTAESFVADFTDAVEMDTLSRIRAQKKALS
jgi:hypothetical protein